MLEYCIEISRSPSSALLVLKRIKDVHGWLKMPSVMHSLISNLSLARMICTATQHQQVVRVSCHALMSGEKTRRLGKKEMVQSDLMRIVAAESRIEFEMADLAMSRLRTATHGHVQIALIRPWRISLTPDHPISANKTRTEVSPLHRPPDLA